MNKHTFLSCILLCVAVLSQAQLTDEGLEVLKANQFDPDFSNYNQQTSLYLSHLSDFAYEDNEQTIAANVAKLNEALPAKNFQAKLIQHKGTSSEVLLFACKQYIVLAFRGTQEKKDFYTNGKFLGYKNVVDSIIPEDLRNNRLTHLPSGHAGFRRSIMELIDKEDLLGEVDAMIAAYEIEPSKMPIYTTGHSLGAALSSLIINILIGEGYDFKGAYHFAPPLAIWYTDAERLKALAVVKEKVYDIVNNTDYISRVGRYSRRNYLHIGKYHRIFAKEKGVPLMFREEERYIKYKFWERFNVTGSLFSKYHSLKHYIHGVGFPDNSYNKIVARSKPLNGCSSMKPKCSDSMIPEELK